MIRNGVILFLLISSCLFAFDKNDYIEINQSIDKMEVYIGEYINYKIELYSAKDLMYSFDGVLFTEKPDIMSIISTNYKSKNSGNYIKKTYEYTVAFYDHGNYALPSFQIEYVYKGVKDAFSNETLFVSVVELSDGSALPDIKKPYSMPYPIFVYIIPIIIAALIILLVIFLIKRKKKKEEESINIYIAEDEEALTALYKLKEKQNEKYIDYVEYYYYLTEIFRRYIARRFELPILEMTTNDIRKYIKKTILPEYEDIIHFLKYSDLIKYAKQKPTLEYLKENTDFCEAYILKYLSLRSNINEAAKNDINDDSSVSKEKQVAQINKNKTQ